MRASILVTWSVLAAVGLAAPATAHDPKPAASSAVSLSPQAQEAATVVDGFHAALRRGDATAAAALLASDALIYESGGVEQGKAEYASHHLGADAAFSKATQSVVTRRSGQANGNLAWIATESTTKGSYKERPINSVGTETMILRREGASWRIVHVHWSSANAR
jgi:ketosteroid isomerase-like protein